jgi:uncharacterized cupredoxin-like copper-binding protein
MTTNTRHQGTLLCISFVLVLLLAGCGGPQALTANLTDTSIQVSSATMPAGTITFHITNTSAAELHEFVIIRTDLNADQLPLAADGTVVEDQLTSPGEKGDIAAGQGGDLTLTLPVGRYLFICNQLGHFKAGMHTVFTVTA